MRVIVVGLGYVGLTAATCLAEAGHSVVGIDRAAERLATLRRGVCPLYEPGLQDQLSRAIRGSRLTFAPSVDDSVGRVDAAVIAVDTPLSRSGHADVTNVVDALRSVFALDPLPRLVMNRSTVPPGTSEELRAAAGSADLFTARYCFSPEFLSQGTAIDDWWRPSRIVLGVWNQEVLVTARGLFAGVEAPWVVTGPTEAEAVKYASNAFLAVKISFANEIANLCDRLGADIDSVIAGLRLDPRVGATFWRPGLGYGDSCLPKDVGALIQHAEGLGYPMRLLEAAQSVNEAQRLIPARLVDDALQRLGVGAARIAVLGLAYEPHSDDLRAAPSLSVVPQLLRRASGLNVWDPLLATDRIAQLFPGAVQADSPEAALAGCGIAVILTEYPQLADVDWAAVADRMVEPLLVIDAKNCLEPGAITAAGLEYRGVGRSGTTVPRAALPMADLSSSDDGRRAA